MGRGPSLVAVWAVWTLVGLLLTQQAYIVRLASGLPISWWRPLADNLIGSYVWALGTPLIFALARQFRIERPLLVRNVGVHLAAASAFNLADAVVNALIAPLIGTPAIPVWMIFTRIFFWNLSCYVAVAGVATALEFARLYRERAVAAAELSARLSQVQLAVLQSQLRPHFLFNTLNAIAEQVYGDPAGADRMVMRLSALLRASLTFADRHEIPLEAELTTLSHYLEIMKVRHHGRLDVEVDVDAAAAAAVVPAMVLQPIVENAVQHGVEPNERPTRVTIRARREQRGLVLTVADGGAGLPAGGVREGTGLRNTRERLAQLYGDRASLTVSGRPGGGVVSEVVVPWRAA